MPKDFPKRLQETLRNWHSQKNDHVLNHLLLAHHYQGVQDTTARLISNKILLDGIESLKQTAGEDLADLLQRCFPNQETARQIAYRKNISATIVQLANFIGSWESVCLDQRFGASYPSP